MTKIAETDSISGLPGGMSSPSIDKVAKALADAQKEIKTITKNKTGKIKGTTRTGAAYEYEYKYADLEAVREAVREIAQKNGLSLVMRPTGNVLHSTLVHESGQWLDYGEYPLGEFETHQKRGAAITYARRYVESCVFDIVTEDDDDAANNASENGKPSSQPPIPHPSNAPAAPSVFQTKEQRDAWLTGLNTQIAGALNLEDLGKIKETYKQRINSLKQSENAGDKEVLRRVMTNFDTRWDMLCPKAPQPKTLNVDAVIQQSRAVPPASPRLPQDIIDDEIPF